MKKNRRELKKELRLLKKLASRERSKIRPETKKSVAAILLIGLAALLILASLDRAGPAGNFLFKTLGKLFGWGYYLIPGVALTVAVLFLLTKERKFMGITFVGALCFIVFGLGFMDVVFPEGGGWVGTVVGVLEIPFGTTASLVLLGTFLLISFLIAFNASIRLRSKETVLPARGQENKPVAEQIVIKTPEPPPAPPPAAPDKEGKIKSEPLIEPVVAEAVLPPFKIPSKTTLNKSRNYVAPPMSLLKSAIEKPTAGDLRANANIIKRTLDGFGIPVEMGEINIGPKVTRYTLKPAEGVKLTRITALNQDLSLALAAHPIRIEAPIPGKSLVGIEVPNKAAAIVRLGNLMSYPEFGNSGSLGFPVGRDVSGEPIFADIEKMPHLLVAGSTGSGKSIFIHSILISLLYKNSPETLKLILIDPKRVELSIYEGMPHLVSPVITESKKTVAVFRWAIQEMERRYELLLRAGSRDIKSYNKNLPTGQAGGHGVMPYLLIVIDEMADLMASYGREVEGSIVRLAQMARATGLHLVVSTQRPSVEVITGLIKANITSRVALQVASQVDSRTILDMAGAEKLLGSGDLLFISGELSKPKRIQGAYISEEEVNSVTDFVRVNNPVAEEAAESVDQTIESIAGDGGSPFDDYGESDDDDELFAEAVRVVKEAKKASASFLQRRLKIGYARAARLLDIMESKGIIGPGEGAKPREILME